MMLLYDPRQRQPWTVWLAAPSSPADLLPFPPPALSVISPSEPRRMTCANPRANVHEMLQDLAQAPNSLLNPRASGFALCSADLLTLIHRAVCTPRLLVIGGDIDPESLVSLVGSVHARNLGDEHWNTMPELPAPTAFAAAVLEPSGGRPQLIGGQSALLSRHMSMCRCMVLDKASAQLDVESADQRPPEATTQSAQLSWRWAAALHTSRDKHSAWRCRDLTIVCGGCDVNDDDLASVEIQRGGCDQAWRLTDQVHEYVLGGPRFAHAVTGTDEFFLVVGGE